MTYDKSKTTIKFSYYHEGLSGDLCHPETKLDYEIDGETNIHEVCNAFENFLLACGYRLNTYETIGVIENND